MSNAQAVRDLPLALAHDFLDLRKKGFSLPKTIVLFGAPEPVMLPILTEMASVLAGVAEVQLSDSNGKSPPCVERTAYRIDLRFFLENLGRAPDSRLSGSAQPKGVQPEYDPGASFPIRASSWANGRQPRRKLLHIDR